MRGLKTALVFMGGAVAGGLASYLIMSEKKKEELSEVRSELNSYYKDKLAIETDNATSEVYAELERMKGELNLANDKLNMAAKTKNEKKVDVASVYIIRPDEFGLRPDYDKFYYTFCEDDGKFYIDASMDTPAEAIEIDDMFQMLHPEEHFGEFEDDAVYIQNDDLRTYIVVYLADGTVEDLDE